MAHSHIRRMQMMQMTGQIPSGQPVMVGQGGGGGSIISGVGSDNNSMISGGGMLQPGAHAPSYISNSYVAGPPLVGRQGSTMSFGTGNFPGRPMSVASNARSASYSNRPPGSTMGGTLPRSGSRTSLHGGGMKMSRSLGASKASLASIKSGKSTIQQEAHDREVQQTLRAPYFGKGRTPFIISIVCFLFGLVCIAVGSAITIIWWYGRLFLTLDREVMIGPVIAASSILFFALGFKYLHDAYRFGSKQRNKTKFRAANASMVKIMSPTRKPQDQAELLVSGTASKHAITRTPLGSRSSLNNIF